MLFLLIPALYVVFLGLQVAVDAATGWHCADAFGKDRPS